MLIKTFVSLLCYVVVECVAVDLSPSHRDSYPRREEPVLPFMITEASPDPAARAAAIQMKRQTFLYGPDPDGSSISFPSGPLGNAMVGADVAGLQSIVTTHAFATAADAKDAAVLISQVWHSSMAW